MSTLKDNVAVCYNYKDIGNLCRLCLNGNTPKESLYSPLEEIFEDDVINFFHVMEKLSLTKLSNNPQYPSYLCVNCISLLNTAYKVNRLLEISQSHLSALFKEDLQVNKSNANIESNNVEIISDKGKYNLKDILIIEENQEHPLNYDGFLKNLGSVISANFVPKNTDEKKCQKHEIHVVDLIPLSGIEDNPVIDVNSVAMELENDKIDTKIFKIEKSPVKNRIYVKCRECEKTFKTKGSLFRHKEMHRRKKSYLCQICGHVSNGRNSLNNHMSLKHQGKRFPCEVCGKKYLSKSHLRYHMIVHKNERLQLCTVCGKSFNYTSSLIYHMRIHTGEKKFQCTFCDRSFSMRCGLNRHLRTHTGLRPYKCSFCEKAFRSKGEVDCHEMTHTGYRPHHCKFCGKGFTKAHNMKVHMLCHAGPFLCEYCQKGFMETAYLKLHMKINHGLNDYEVDGEHILIVQEDGAEFEDFNETLITTE